MKIVLNPKYVEAEYEIAYGGEREGGFVFFNVAKMFRPLRFTKDTYQQASELMQQGKWDELRNLSIPPFVSVAERNGGSEE